MADRPLLRAGFWKGSNLPFRGKLNVRRPGPITALDLDGDVLRVVQAAPRGTRTVVTRVATAPLGIPADAARDPVRVGEAVAKALGELRVKPGQVVMGVPRHQVILRTLSMPVIDDVRELASMVHMQIGKDLPFRAEEAVIDFKLQPGEALPDKGEKDDSAPDREVGSSTPAKADVLVAALRREAVEFHATLAGAAGFKLVALGWLSQANARCVQACQLAAPTEAVALISLRSDEVAVDIVAQQSLVFSRGASLNLGVEPPLIAPGEDSAAKPAMPRQESATPAEAFAEAVTIEVVRTLHSYSGTDSHQPVTKLVVAGATGKESLIVDALLARLAMPCSLLDPATALDIRDSVGLDAAGAVSGIGLALGVNDPEGLPFDFLNPKRPAVQRNMRRIRMMTAGAVGMTLLVALLGFRSHLIKQRMKIQIALQTELSEAKKKVPTYRRMQVQAAAIQNWAKDSRNWLEQFAYLSAVLPGSEDVYLTSLSIGAQGNIHLAVQARNGEILANLDRQLRAAGYEVKPLAITPGNDKHGYNFRSSVELLVPPKMKIDLTKVQPPARPADDASLEGKSRAPRKGGRT